jgi:hypothetical protein
MSSLPARATRPSVQSGTPRASALRTPLGSKWVPAVIAASVIAGLAHVPVTGQHLEEAPYIGVLFVLLEIASLVLAIGLMIVPSRAVLLATAAVGALAILAFVVSRSVGLPQIGDDIGNWTEPLAVVSVAAELIMAVGGLAAGARGDRTSGDVWTRVNVSLGVVVLLAGVFATFFAMQAERTGDDVMGASVGGDEAALTIAASLPK